MGSGCSSEKTGSMVQLNRDNIPNFKIVLIGDPGVGKTNVLLRYSKRQFDYSYRPTQKVTIDHVVEKINVPQNLVVSLTIWDIPGSEDMDLRSTYYRNVDAVIAIVDMSDANIIELAGIWKQDFLNKATKTRETIETLPSGVRTTHIENVKDFDPQSVPVLLLGNKYDLVEEKIQREEMKGALNSDDGEVIFIPVEEIESSKEDEERPPFVEMNNEGTETKSGTESINPESELEKIFSPQSAPSENEKVHECVKLLEEIEEKHKFIGSIIVSAKNDDGSVDAAMKSLVRYLLNKSKFIQPKNSAEKKEKIKQKNKKKPRVTDYKNLSTVGIQVFDTIFTRCDVPVKKCGDYVVFYDLCLKRVKQSCADQGYLTESGSSLEDTIVALREAVSQSFGRELEVETEGDFIRLTFPLDDEDDDDKLKIKQNRPLLAILDNFHQEYAAICKAILRDGPNIVAVLEKLDAKLENEMDSVDSKVKELVTKDIPEGKPMDEKKYRDCLEITKATCERNRVRIVHARKQMGDLMNTVENAIKKIKASLLW